MPKAILVMDMPESCRDCVIRSLADDCQAVSRFVQEYRHDKSRPDWCPLQGAEQWEKDVWNSGHAVGYTKGYDDGYALGITQPI